MKRILFILACAWSAVSALGQPYPNVQVTTNAALVYPTNFFVANSNLLNAAVAASGATGDVTEEELDAAVLPLLHKTNDMAFGLFATNGLSVFGDLTADAMIQGQNLTLTGVPTNRFLFLNSGGLLDDVVSPTLTQLGYVDATSSIQTQLDAKQPLITGSATSIDSETITASRLVVTDGSGKIAVSATTATEAGYVSGVSSSIQTQLDGKQATITGSATTIDTETLTASRALVTDGSGKVAVSAVTATEVGFLDGVTSSIQAQIDAIEGGGASSTIFVTPQEYGADGTDTSDDRAAFQSAWNAATASIPNKILYIPYGTYYLGQNNLQLPKGLHMVGGKGSVLKPMSYPGTVFSDPDRQNALIRGDDNVTIEGHLTIDMRNNDAAFTQNTEFWYSALAFREKTNFMVNGLTVINGYDNPVWVRLCGSPKIYNLTVRESPQVLFMKENTRPEVINLQAYNVKATNSEISGTAITFFNNKYTTLRGCYVNDVLSSDRSPEFFWTTINLFGEDFGQFSDITLTGVDPNSNTPGFLGLNLDGGVFNTIQNATILGYHHNSGSALQIEGAQDFNVVNCLFEGLKSFGPGMSTAGGSGIYMTEWGIESADRGGYVWRDFGHQWRGRSLPARGRFTNVRVRGFHNGLQAVGTDLRFDGCEFTGANFVNVRLLPPLSVGEYYSRNRVDHKLGNISFNNCEIAWGKTYGVALQGGDQISFVDCDIHDNNQNGSSFEIGCPSTETGVAQTGSTQTVIIHGESVSTDAWKGYYVFFPTLGTSGLSGRIENNSTTTFTLTGPIGAATEGASFVINQGLVGRVTLAGCNIYKTDIALTNLFSLDPTQNISVAGTPFHVSGTETHNLRMSQVVTLKGVLSGNADLQARVLYKDADYADRIWMECVSPTTGTFQSTAGTAIVAGTGTMTYVDNPTSYEHSGRLTVTGSGTVFGEELDGSWWFKALDQDWMLSSYALTDTDVKVHIPYSANFSAKTFLISRFTILSTTRTGAAIDIRNTPGQIFIRDTTVYDELVNAASGDDPDRYYPAMSISSSAPNARSKLTGVFPRLGIGPNYVFANGSSTTVTNLNGGSEGMEINILGDANTTLGFAATATSFVGNSGSNKALSATKLVRGTYRSGKWYLTVIE